jgi:ribosomal protein L6P/L9E
MFTGFISRTLVFIPDQTGFALVTPAHQVYFPFDTRFFNCLKAFCVSIAQFFSAIAQLRSIYIGLKGGYFCVLHVKGIGFKVFWSLIQRALYFFLGFNHLTKFRVPASVNVKPLKNHVLVFTFRNDVFGTTVYHMRRLRFPDPYRGKGIRYRYQIMRFKPGKQR